MLIMYLNNSTSFIINKKKLNITGGVFFKYLNQSITQFILFHLDIIILVKYL